MEKAFGSFLCKSLIVNRKTSIPPRPFQYISKISRSKSLFEALGNTYNGWNLDPCNWITSINQRWMIEYPIPKNHWLYLFECCEIYPKWIRDEIDKNFPECRGKFLTVAELHFIASRGFLPPSWKNLRRRRKREIQLQRICPEGWTLFQISFFIDLEGWLSGQQIGAFDLEIAKMFESPPNEWIWYQFYLLRIEWSDVWKELPTLIQEWEDEKIGIQAIPMLGWNEEEICKRTRILTRLSITEFLDRWTCPGFFQLDNWDVLRPENSEDMSLNPVSITKHPICFGTWKRFWVFSLQDIQSILNWKILNPYDPTQIWTPEHRQQLQSMTSLVIPEIVPLLSQGSQKFKNWLRNCTRVGLWVACSPDPSEQLWRLFQEFREMEIPNITPVIRHKRHWVRYQNTDMLNILTRALEGDLCQNDCSQILFWSGIYYSDPVSS